MVYGSLTRYAGFGISEKISQADEMMYMVKNYSRDNIVAAQQGILKQAIP